MTRPQASRPFSVPILVGIALLAPACAPRAPRPAEAAHAPATARCHTLQDDLRALGTDARTLDVVVHHGTEACLRGDARHLTVTVDGEATTLSLPCVAKGSRDLVIQAPPPTYPAFHKAVAEGTHRVSVRDEDTGDEDFEEFAVPHVELLDGTLTVGQYVDAWVGPRGVAVHGPTTLRMPGL